MKYEQWLNEWLNFCVKPIAKRSTIIRYQQHVEQIMPALGGCELEELSAQKLQEFVAELIREGFATNTVNCIITTIKASLKRAVVNGVVDAHHSDFVLRPRTREKQSSCFTKKEQRKLERYVNESKRGNLIGIIISLYTGLRVGELLALKWSDVDFVKSRITVSGTGRDSWVNGEYVKIVGTTKTQSSERTIPLPKQLLPRLKELKKNSKCEYVISGYGNHGAEIRTYQRAFENLLKKLNIPHRGFHALRHTFATRALEVGMDVKTLSEILGHSNPAITLKRYAHSTSEHKRDMMNKVGKLLTLDD